MSDDTEMTDQQWKEHCEDVKADEWRDQAVDREAWNDAS